MVSKLFPRKSGDFFFWFVQEFEEKYWVATFIASYGNFGWEFVEKIAYLSSP